MSGGIGSLSDDALMAQLAAAGYQGGGSPAPAPSGVSGLSDAELLRQLGASRRVPASQKVSSQRANPFDQGGAASFSDRFGTGPMASTADVSSGLGAGVRAKADEMLVGKPDGLNQAAAAVIPGANAMLLNAPRAAGAAAATVLGPLLGRESRSYTQNLDLAREQEEALGRQYPKTSLAGTVGGIVGGAAVLPGNITTTGGLTRAAQGAFLGGIYGGTSELIGTADPLKAAKAGGIGALAGGLATPVLDKAIPLVEKGGKALYGLVSRGVPVTNPEGALTTTAMAMLRREGVPAETLTPDVQAGIARAVAQKGESEGAIREALASEFGIPLSRGQSTGDARALTLEQAARAGDRGEKAKGVAVDFDKRQAEAIEAAGTRFADRAGRGVSLDNPAQAFEPIADQARALSTRSTFEADAAQQGADDVLARLRGAMPVDSVDAGGVIAGALRNARAQRKGLVDEAYAEAGNIPGEFAPGALDRIGSRVRDRLGADVPVDPVLTPAASRILTDLDNLPGLFRTEDGAGPTLKQVDQVRKRFAAYYPATAQNPTDRRALNAIREEFDGHVQDALGAGLFGPRQAAQANAGAFPGEAALTAQAGATGRAKADAKAPESLIQFLGRNGGIRLDDDARAADLGRVSTGFGPLARKNGRPIEDFRDKLASEGFIRPDDDTGAISRKIGDELHDLIAQERAGQPTYRLADRSRGAAQDAGGRLADDSAAYAERLAPFRQQVADDLAASGVRLREIDESLLHDASERLFRREVDDPAEAYERAILAREAPQSRTESSEAVPFPEVGDAAPASSSALPGASQDAAGAVDAWRKARLAHRYFKQDFEPQGAGDDVGLALRRFFTRDAEPVEVARALYGGNVGLATRMSDRLKRIAGESSDAWAAHQQGYLSSILQGRDMSPRAVADRVDAALTGERRGLTYRVLTGEQVAGLKQFVSASRNAQQLRQGVPDWVTNLGRTDFNPNKVMGDLLGAGVPGARPGSAAFAGSLKKMVGEGSAEWSGLRLATWQQLAMKPDGTGMLPPKQVASRIREMVDGKGAAFARQMFEPELLAELRRLGSAVGATVRADGTPLPNAGGTAGKIAGRALDAIAAAIGFKIAGPAGAVGAFTARVGSKHVQGALSARSARQSFEGGAPSFLPVPASRPIRGVGVGAGYLGGEAQ